MLQRLCVSLAGRRASMLTRSRASASKSLFGTKSKSASKASTVFLTNKAEIFNTKRTVTHWEDEELPGTSKDPRVIEFNNRLREHFDKGNYKAVEDLLNEAKNNDLPTDIQTYAMHVKLIKVQYEEKYKGIPFNQRLPDMSRLDAEIDAELGPQIFGSALDQALKTNDTQQMISTVADMRKRKVRPTTDIMKTLIKGLGEQGKTLLQEMVKKGEADQKYLTLALQQ